MSHWCCNQVFVIVIFVGEIVANALLLAWTSYMGKDQDRVAAVPPRSEQEDNSTQPYLSFPLPKWCGTVTMTVAEWSFEVATLTSNLTQHADQRISA